jgi:predicted kinase
MPRLIHLNGPPAIGKSTLAQRYVDQHAGVLNLDIDLVRRLIGGWREDFSASGRLVRPVALSMARAHLQGGHDVVMPQYLGQLSEIEKFEAAARESQAQFVEVFLMNTKAQCLRRFAERSRAATEPWHREVNDLVASSGGMPMLGQMHDQLTELMELRPDAVVVRSGEGAVERTYLTLLRALGGDIAQRAQPMSN